MQTMHALAGITQLLSNMADAQREASVGPQRSQPVIKFAPAERTAIADRHDEGGATALCDAAAADEGGATALRDTAAAERHPDAGNVVEVADMLTKSLTETQSAKRRQLPGTFKRPSASTASSILKRPAASPTSPAGMTRVVSKAFDLPKDWTVWAIPRGDKMYVDPSGKRYRSMVEVNAALT